MVLGARVSVEPQGFKLHWPSSAHDPVAQGRGWLTPKPKTQIPAYPVQLFVALLLEQRRDLSGHARAGQESRS